MEFLEIRLLDEYFAKVDPKQRLYKRKWWPKIEDAKRIAEICNVEQPDWFIEVGTGNGITASYVASMGIRVVTFDPADRPKVYLNETFPLKRVPRFINFVNQTIEESLGHWVCDGKVVWSLDGMPGEKSIVSYLKYIRPLTNPGDLILSRGQSERV